MLRAWDLPAADAAVCPEAVRAAGKGSTSESTRYRNMDVTLRHTHTRITHIRLT